MAPRCRAGLFNRDPDGVFKMKIPLCKFCGWGTKPECETSAQAEACDLNRENVRKYALRHRDEPTPNIVRSVRYQGADGKGDSFEFLERTE